MPLMASTFYILSLTDQTEQARLEQAANLLIVGFHEHWPDSWADHESAMDEVREMLAPARICRAAIDEQTGEVMGWIGGIPEYDGNVWELHPLVVRPDLQGQGIGRTLVQDFEEQVQARGGITIMLGSDDEDGMTTLSQVNLYENTWDHIHRIRNLKGHPYEFYQKMGYTITGVVPDANGPGKPDILMSKRVGKAL
jgi:aminoglycoside 6'-N-acetyltransferase I